MMKHQRNIKRGLSWGLMCVFALLMGYSLRSWLHGDSEPGLWAMPSGTVRTVATGIQEPGQELNAHHAGIRTQGLSTGKPVTADVFVTNGLPVLYQDAVNNISMLVREGNEVWAPHADSLPYGLFRSVNVMPSAFKVIPRPNMKRGDFFYLPGLNKILPGFPFLELLPVPDPEIKLTVNGRLHQPSVAIRRKSRLEVFITPDPDFELAAGGRGRYSLKTIELVTQNKAGISQVVKKASVGKANTKTGIDFFVPGNLTLSPGGNLKGFLFLKGLVWKDFEGKMRPVKLEREKMIIELKIR